MLARATAKITLGNLACDMRRRVWIDDRNAPAWGFKRDQRPLTPLDRPVTGAREGSLPSAPRLWRQSTFTAPSTPVSRYQSLTEGDVRAFCRDRIANHIVPRYVRFVTAFPIAVTRQDTEILMREATAREAGREARVAQTQCRVRNVSV